MKKDGRKQVRDAISCWFQEFLLRELIEKVQYRAQRFRLQIQRLLFALCSLWAPRGGRVLYRWLCSVVISKRIWAAQIFAQRSTL